jgi:ABC-2 type transport system permease protein
MFPVLNLTYYRLELRRLLRDKVTMFFTAGLPAFFYVIFGASQDYGDEPVRDGNVAMLIMIAMAAYGAVTATTGIGGTAAVERMQGWGRQLGLTPITDGQYVTVKAATSLTIAAIPIGLVYAIGAFSGAEAPLSVWITSAALLLVGAAMFSLYGLNFGLMFRSEAAVSAAGGSLVILAFLGNIFFPLSGWMLTVAKFTPLYGYVALARRSLTGGAVLDPNTNELIGEPLWQVLGNVAFWTVVFAGLAVILVQGARERQ